MTQADPTAAPLGEALATLINRLETWPLNLSTGVCMCGAEMKGHPYDNHPPTDSGEYNMGEAIKEAKAALAASAPAVSEAVAQILKGVGKINGDGWKDTTTVGEVVFVWNDELPSPFGPGQYRRVGCEHWTASTAQYDFAPATVDEARQAVAAPQSPQPAAPSFGRKTVATLIWERFAPSNDVDPENALRGEYILAADAILSALQATAGTGVGE